MLNTAATLVTARGPSATHLVTNQVPPLESHNLALDPALQEALIREGGEWGLDEVTKFGALCGSRKALRWGELADRNRPILHTHDRYGHRIDEVEYDPAYHQLMKLAISNGLHAAPWSDDRPGAHVVRAAKTSVWAADPGILCPIWMTYAVIPALRHNTELAAVYEPLLTKCAYDPRPDAVSAKTAITAGMSMTEKQGGSDLRAGSTQGNRGSDNSFSLIGHKWFTSAPMSDIFLVLAQAPGGLSCFLLPRVLPDGGRNRMYLQRLKDKLGNHANASSEVEYDGATAWLVGEEGRGVSTIMEMVGMGRLDVALGSAALMRVALTHAIHHSQHRKAFGANLIEQPLMRNVLADLALEAEAATTATMWLAGASDRAIRGSERDSLLKRIGVPAIKYWVCKRATQHVGEAMECLGGNGYVEESGMPRLYREAPLAGIWEGSGNVTALDTVRALAVPGCLEVLFEELAAASGADPRLDAHIQMLRRQVLDRDLVAYRSRVLNENICLALQGSLLVRHGNSSVAEAFVATRLGRDWGGAFGTLPAQLDLTTILQRAMAITADGPTQSPAVESASPWPDREP
ncbi:acyl-CoA dehydrogenase family protein [Mycobacterium sp. 852002-51057_SCH5723018]|uniref:acyl-CoA dehydrogenase family protein n=1 Tax=Mycobacterium sp. 852002-51057_SCH5723018 TaxID=1834094 RepID=UPI0009ED6C22|nr:acyl-CoA dehydrogenase family protein [Mycobacterium sp. 852002-51057_SCH5723018]